LAHDALGLLKEAMEPNAHGRLHPFPGRATMMSMLYCFYKTSVSDKRARKEEGATHAVQTFFLAFFGTS